MLSRILIVGDQVNYLRRAAEALESKGYITNTAAGAAQAVARIIAQRPDLILMGVALRGMDGLTLTMHLKAEPATRDIRIIAWAAPASKRDEERAAAAGCDGFIVQSSDASTLAEELARFLYDAAPARLHDASQCQSLNVLIVDDNALGRELLAFLLKNEGHATFEATDGVEALAVMEQQRIDAVISDVMMPSIDGYQLCHKIRSDERLRDVPVIIYSGALTSPMSEMLASELGAVRFVRKPAPLDTLIATLREVLSEAERRRSEASQADAAAGPRQNERLMEQLEMQNHKLRKTTEQLLETNHKLLVLTRALEQSEEALRKKNAQLEEDLRMARETHRALLPRSYPSLPRGTPPQESALRFHHYYFPRNTVSGDFFDLQTVSETKAGVFICDVMGHGVRAALVTVVIRGVIEQLATHVFDPGAVLTEINRTLVPILREAGAPMFASAFYMIADVASGEIQYTNAGHPSPFLVRRDAGAIERLGVTGRAHGPALGLMEESRYPTGRRVVAPHDLVLLFTDGIFEIDGPGEESFGQERLLDAVRSRISLPSGQLLDEVLDEVHKFSLTDEFDDDVCLLGMEVDHLCA